MQGTGRGQREKRGKGWDRERGMRRNGGDRMRDGGDKGERMGWGYREQRTGKGMGWDRETQGQDKVLRGPVPVEDLCRSYAWG